MMEVIDNLQIEETLPDTCLICNKHFKHYRMLKMDKKLGMKEVELRTAHTGCRKLVQRRQKLLDDLLEVEYDLFARIY